MFFTVHLPQWLLSARHSSDQGPNIQLQKSTEIVDVQPGTLYYEAQLIYSTISENRKLIYNTAHY